MRKDLLLVLGGMVAGYLVASYNVLGKSKSLAKTVVDFKEPEGAVSPCEQKWLEQAQTIRATPEVLAQMKQQFLEDCSKKG